LGLQRAAAAKLARKETDHYVEWSYCWRDMTTQSDGMTCVERFVCIYHDDDILL
jgi:hypothetical protein